MKIMRTGNEELGFIEFANYLYTINSNPKTILEIGSYIGESSLILRNRFPDSFLFLVDPWIDNYDINDPTITVLPMSKVEQAFDDMMGRSTKFAKFKMLSDEFFEIMPENFFDIIYIDGNHSYEYVYKDIQNSLKALKPNGILSGHDYGRNIQHTLGVTKAIEELIGTPDVTFMDSSWIKLGLK